MRSILLMALIFGACQPATVELPPPVSSPPASSTLDATTVDPLGSTPPTSEPPAPDVRVSIYPYQSEAAIAEALASSQTRPAGFDWGLDYVKWVVGWDDAVAYDGTDGADRWGTFYRSIQGDTIYIVSGILGYNRNNEPIVGIDHATTFFDAAGYDLAIDMRESTDGWFLDVTTPSLQDLALPADTSTEILVQFESASYEVAPTERTTTIGLGARPHTWGILQISYRDASGHAVGWYAGLVNE